MQALIIIGLVFLIICIIEFFIIKSIYTKYKKTKADADIYKEYVVSANKRFEFMYNYIRELGKIDEWKIKELYRLQNEENEEAVIADIINANNSRVHNDTEAKS